MSRPEAVNTRMQSFIEGLIYYRRLVFSLVILFIAVGVLALGSMARQEDPSFPYRAGLLKVFYPGGTPLQIEKLITEPVEEELAQVSEIDEVKSTSRDDLAIFTINLQDYVYDTDAAWDRVETAVERARLQFPAGVTRIEFDDRQIDMPAAVLSITGSEDPILLEQAALKVKRHIIGIAGLSRIEIEGAPAKEVIVKLDQDAISRIGLSREAVAGLIAERNRIVPGGLISSRDKNIRLNTQSDFDSLDELRRTMLRLPSGQTVSLESIATVSMEPRLPLASQAFQDGQRTVSLGVIAERGQVDVIEFGKVLRERIDSIRPSLAPLVINESFYQADYTQARLFGLRTNLLISVLVIAAIVFFAMGWRTGLMVSAVLPVVSMIAIGVYSAGGGVFHQMAVIGMVISLGILIDNAIVVVEHIEASMRKSVELGQAIRDVIQVMAKPLLASTGTTIAAFIPLLLAEGGVGDFTRAVPIMIVISLVISYLLSILVLPLVSFYWLQGRKPGGELAFKLTDNIAARSAAWVTAAPLRVLLIVAALLGISVAMAPFLKQEFFPSTDRAQIVIDIEMPNNTPLAMTEQLSREVEQALLEQPTVAKTYRYVGGAGFRFYYNMVGAPNESHIARITVNTRSEKDNQVLVDWVRDELKPRYPDAVLIPKLLGQGPPRPAPVEIRVKHADLAVLHDASQAVKALMARTRGVTELRTDLDLGTPEVQLSIQDAAALSFGLQPNAVASAVYAESRGLLAGEFRYDTDPVPIRVRSSQGQRSSIEVVENQYVYSPSVSQPLSGPQAQSATPLSQLAAMRTVWTPTTLRHHDYQRAVTVLAQVKPGFAFNQVLADFKSKLGNIELPASVQIEYGGDEAASEKANNNIATAAPIALGVLLFFMMYQFNSFRRIAIVFVSIPLAAVGVIPGLVLSGQPFGFQSLLGVIALIGIVVNNAIVLIDVVDQSLVKGNDIKQAVSDALGQRTAPILLTTATTILGLLPLALSASTLWPPMAWAIISGLSLSTMLTLVAIPALCVMVLGKKQARVAPIRQIATAQASTVASVGFVMAIAALVGIATYSRPIQASESVRLDVQSIIQRVQNNAEVEALSRSAKAARLDFKSSQREAWAPKITLGGEVSFRDSASTITLPQPFGDLTVGDDRSYVYQTKISQPLFDRSKQRYGLRAARQQAEIAELRQQAVLHQLTGEALQQYFGALALIQVRVSLTALEASLASRLLRIDKELTAGRVLRTDKLQVEVALNRVRQQLIENANSTRTVKTELRNLLGLSANSNMQLVGAPTIEQPVAVQLAELTCYQRKDCLAVALEGDALKSNIKALKASYLPTVNLSLSDVRSDGQLFVPDSDQRAMLEFSWSLFNGGARSSQKAALKERRNASLSQLRSVQQSLRLQIEGAKAAISNAASQQQLALSSVNLDQERLRLSQQRYDEGLLNIDELLDAEASLEQSRSDLVRAKLAKLAALVQLKQATGVEY